MTPDAFFAALEATWPPARKVPDGPWLLRDGQGGGQRVCAATPTGPVDGADIARAETAMAALGQVPLFMMRPENAALDAALEARGYRRHDPVVAYACTISDLPEPAFMTSFPHWPPLAIGADLWAEAGIGPARLAVMARVTGAKVAILGRVNDRAAAMAFVACHGSIAMLHALEVTPRQRRQGAGRQVVLAAARWAASQGADQLALAVTEANAPARALYAGLGMDVVGQYHYRVR